jgi:hypothetical protein
VLFANMPKTSKSISHHFPMLLISQPQIWFIHTCDLDTMRRAYSIATYKREEPTWITMLYILHEVAGRLCVFPFTQSMNNPCWTLIIVTPYQINNQFPVHLPAVIKMPQALERSSKECYQPPHTQRLVLQHSSCITQLHS